MSFRETLDLLDCKYFGNSCRCSKCILQNEMNLGLLGAMSGMLLLALTIPIRFGGLDLGFWEGVQILVALTILITYPSTHEFLAVRYNLVGRV